MGDDGASGGSEKKAKPRRRWLRWLVRIVATLVLLPVVAVLVVYVYLHTGAGKARVKAALLERIGRRVDGTVEIAELDYELFGDVALGGVVVRDAQGREAISLRRAKVRSGWGDLLRGRAVALDAVEIEGLHVHLVQDASGGSNLKRLVKPSEEPEPAEPAQPARKPIVVSSLRLADVDVEIDRPDGSRITVADLAIDGSLRVVRADKSYDVALTRIALDFGLEKPATGLEVAVKNLATGLAVEIEGGKGTITLRPLSADVALKASERGIDRSFPVRLDELSLTVGEGELDVGLLRLSAGALALGSVEVRGDLAGTRLEGVPEADVVGLRVVAKELNALLGKEVLKSDVDVEAHLGGTDERPTLRAAITAGGGARIDVEAGIEGPGSDEPRFEIAVKARGVDTAAILGSGVRVPPIRLAELDVGAKGTGKELLSLDVDARVTARGARVRGIEIDAIEADAELDSGQVGVKNLRVEALGQALVARGDYGLLSKQVDLELTLDGDVAVALARLSQAGVEVKTKLPKGAARLAKDDLKVRVTGHAQGDLVVRAKVGRLTALGGTLKLDAEAKIHRGDTEAGEKPVRLDGLDAKVDVFGLRLSSILALRGKKLPKGIDAVLDLRARASGTALDPKVRLDLTGKTLREKEGDPRLGFSARADVTRKVARVELEAHNLASVGEVVLRGDATLPLSLEGDKKGLDPYGRLHAELEIPRRSFLNLKGYAPLEPISPLSPLSIIAPLLDEPNGEVTLNLEIDGTVAQPKGKLLAEVELARHGEGKANHKATLTAKVDSVAGGGTRADLDLTLILEKAPQPAARVTASAAFSTSPLLGGAAGVTYDAHVAVGPMPLEALPDVPQLDHARRLGGTVAIKLDAKGDRRDVTAGLDVELLRIQPNAEGPFDFALGVDLEPEATKIAGRVDTGGAPLVVIGGQAEIPGRGLFATIRKMREAGHDPKLDVVVEVAARPLASLAHLSERLDKKPGTLDGKIAVGGTLKVPVAKGSLGVSAVDMCDGTRGGLGVDLDAGAERIEAVVGLGLREAAAAPVRVVAKIDRDRIAPFRDGRDPLPVEAEIRGSRVALPKLVPAFVAEDARDAFTGTLEWNMDGRVLLETREQGVKVADVVVDGHLDVDDGGFRLPGTKRVWERVFVKVDAVPGRIVVEDVSAHERDGEVTDRWVKLDGELAIQGFSPKASKAHLRAHKWLLFARQGSPVGPVDAPRGSIDIDAQIRIEDIDRPVRIATVRIDKLDVNLHDRFDKAHQPEDVHAGDVFFVGKDVQKGRLSVPEAVKEAAKRAAAPAAAQPAPPAAPDAAPPDAAHGGLDAEITIAKGAKLVLFAYKPLELHPHGTITLKRRPTGAELRGRLDMTGGALSLGGAMHPLREGSLVFDDKHPSGWMDLWFEKPLAPWALRNVSEASAGRAIEIHMFGPLTDNRTVLAGAGSPGALADLLSMHNQGRERFHSEPALPESIAVELPQYQGLLTLSFFSVNLPHLLFLDRVAGWSDPYENHRAYGRIRHYEADGYFGGGRGRFRAASRPPGAGRSEAEAEALYLFVNDPRVLFGVGGTAGSRGGGGPAVIFEWSSEK